MGPPSTQSLHQRPLSDDSRAGKASAPASFAAATFAAPAAAYSEPLLLRVLPSTDTRDRTIGDAGSAPPPSSSLSTAVSSTETHIIGLFNTTNDDGTRVAPDRVMMNTATSVLRSGISGSTHPPQPPPQPQQQQPQQQQHRLLPLSPTRGRSIAPESSIEQQSQIQGQPREGIVTVVRRLRDTSSASAPSTARVTSFGRIHSMDDSLAADAPTSFRFARALSPATGVAVTNSEATTDSGYHHDDDGTVIRRAGHDARTAAATSSEVQSRPSGGGIEAPGWSDSAAEVWIHQRGEVQGWWDVYRLPVRGGDAMPQSSLSRVADTTPLTDRQRESDTTTTITSATAVTAAAGAIGTTTAAAAASANEGACSEHRFHHSHDTTRVPPPLVVMPCVSMVSVAPLPPVPVHDAVCSRNNERGTSMEHCLSVGVTASLEEEVEPCAEEQTLVVPLTLPATDTASISPTIECIATLDTILDKATALLSQHSSNNATSAAAGVTALSAVSAAAALFSRCLSGFVDEHRGTPLSVERVHGGGATATAVAADAPTEQDATSLTDAIFDEGVRAVKSGELARAHALFLAHLTRQPFLQHPLTAFNLACTAALCGGERRIESLRWLRRAVLWGLVDAALMTSDADLVSLHGDLAFEAIVAAADAARRFAVLRGVSPASLQAFDRRDSIAAAAAATPPYLHPSDSASAAVTAGVDSVAAEGGEIDDGPDLTPRATSVSGSDEDDDDDDGRGHDQFTSPTVPSRTAAVSASSHTYGPARHTRGSALLVQLSSERLPTARVLTRADTSTAAFSCAAAASTTTAVSGCTVLLEDYLAHVVPLLPALPEHGDDGMCDLVQGDVNPFVLLRGGELLAPPPPSNVSTASVGLPIRGLYCKLAHFLAGWMSGNEHSTAATRQLAHAAMHVLTSPLPLTPRLLASMESSSSAAAGATDTEGTRVVLEAFAGLLDAVLRTAASTASYLCLGLQPQLSRMHFIESWHVLLSISPASDCCDELAARVDAILLSLVESDAAAHSLVLFLLSHAFSSVITVPDLRTTTSIRLAELSVVEEHSLSALIRHRLVSVINRVVAQYCAISASTQLSAAPSLSSSSDSSAAAQSVRVIMDSVAGCAQKLSSLALQTGGTSAVRIPELRLALTAIAAALVPVTRASTSALAARAVSCICTTAVAAGGLRVLSFSVAAADAWLSTDIFRSGAPLPLPSSWRSMVTTAQEPASFSDSIHFFSQRLLARGDTPRDVTEASLSSLLGAARRQFGRPPPLPASLAAVADTAVYSGALAGFLSSGLLPYFLSGEWRADVSSPLEQPHLLIPPAEQHPQQQQQHATSPPHRQPPDARLVSRLASVWSDALKLGRRALQWAQAALWIRSTLVTGMRGGDIAHAVSLLCGGSHGATTSTADDAAASAAGETGRGTSSPTRAASSSAQSAPHFDPTLASTVHALLGCLPSPTASVGYSDVGTATLLLHHQHQHASHQGLTGHRVVAGGLQLHSPPSSTALQSGGGGGGGAGSGAHSSTPLHHLDPEAVLRSLTSLLRSMKKQQGSSLSPSVGGMSVRRCPVATLLRAPPAGAPTAASLSSADSGPSFFEDDRDEWEDDAPLAARQFIVDCVLDRVEVLLSVCGPRSPVTHHASSRDTGGGPLAPHLRSTMATVNAWLQPCVCEIGALSNGTARLSAEQVSRLIGPLSTGTAAAASAPASSSPFLAAEGGDGGVGTALPPVSDRIRMSVWASLRDLSTIHASQLEGIATLDTLLSSVLSVIRAGSAAAAPASVETARTSFLLTASTCAEVAAALTSLSHCAIESDSRAVMPPAFSHTAVALLHRLLAVSEDLLKASSATDEECQRATFGAVQSCLQCIQRVVIGASVPHTLARVHPVLNWLLLLVQRRPFPAGMSTEGACFSHSTSRSDAAVHVLRCSNRSRSSRAATQRQPLDENDERVIAVDYGIDPAAVLVDACEYLLLCDRVTTSPPPQSVLPPSNHHNDSATILSPATPVSSARLMSHYYLLALIDCVDSHSSVVLRRCLRTLGGTGSISPSVAATAAALRRQATPSRSLQPHTRSSNSGAALSSAAEDAWPIALAERGAAAAVATALGWSRAASVLSPSFAVDGAPLHQALAAFLSPDSPHVDGVLSRLQGHRVLCLRVLPRLMESLACFASAAANDTPTPRGDVQSTCFQFSSVALERLLSLAGSSLILPQSELHVATAPAPASHAPTDEARLHELRLSMIAEPANHCTDSQVTAVVFAENASSSPISFSFTLRHRDAPLTGTTLGMRVASGERMIVGKWAIVPPRCGAAALPSLFDLDPRSDEWYAYVVDGLTLAWRVDSAVPQAGAAEGSAAGALASTAAEHVVPAAVAPHSVSLPASPPPDEEMSAPLLSCPLNFNFLKRARVHDGEGSGSRRPRQQQQSENAVAEERGGAAKMRRIDVVVYSQSSTSTVSSVGGTATTSNTAAVESGTAGEFATAAAAVGAVDGLSSGGGRGNPVKHAHHVPPSVVFGIRVLRPHVLVFRSSPTAPSVASRVSPPAVLSTSAEPPPASSSIPPSTLGATAFASAAATAAAAAQRPLDLASALFECGAIPSRNGVSDISSAMQLVPCPRPAFIALVTLALESQCLSASEISGILDNIDAQLVEQSGGVAGDASSLTNFRDMAVFGGPLDASSTSSSLSDLPSDVLERAPVSASASSHTTSSGRDNADSSRVWWVTVCEGSRAASVGLARALASTGLRVQLARRPPPVCPLRNVELLLPRHLIAAARAPHSSAGGVSSSTAVNTAVPHFAAPAADRFSHADDCLLYSPISSEALASAREILLARTIRSSTHIAAKVVLRGGDSSRLPERDLEGHRRVEAAPLPELPAMALSPLQPHVTLPSAACATTASQVQVPLTSWATSGSAQDLLEPVLNAVHMLAASLRMQSAQQQQQQQRPRLVVTDDDEEAVRRPPSATSLDSRVIALGLGALAAVGGEEVLVRAGVRVTVASSVLRAASRLVADHEHESSSRGFGEFEGARAHPQHFDGPAWLQCAVDGTTVVSLAAAAELTAALQLRLPRSPLAAHTAEAESVVAENSGVVGSCTVVYLTPLASALPHSSAHSSAPQFSRIPEGLYESLPIPLSFVHPVDHTFVLEPQSACAVKPPEIVSAWLRSCIGSRDSAGALLSALVNVAEAATAALALRPLRSSAPSPTVSAAAAATSPLWLCAMAQSMSLRAAHRIAGAMLHLGATPALALGSPASSALSRLLKLIESTPSLRVDSALTGDNLWVSDARCAASRAWLFNPLICDGPCFGECGSGDERGEPVSTYSTRTAAPALAITLAATDNASEQRVSLPCSIDPTAIWHCLVLVVGHAASHRHPASGGHLSVSPGHTLHASHEPHHPLCIKSDSVQFAGFFNRDDDPRRGLPSCITPATLALHHADVPLKYGGSAARSGHAAERDSQPPAFAIAGASSSGSVLVAAAAAAAAAASGFDSDMGMTSPSGAGGSGGGVQRLLSLGGGPLFQAMAMSLSSAATSLGGGGNTATAAASSGGVQTHRAQGQSQQQQQQLAQPQRPLTPAALAEQQRAILVAASAAMQCTEPLIQCTAAQSVLLPSSARLTAASVRSAALAAPAAPGSFNCSARGSDDVVIVADAAIPLPSANTLGGDSVHAAAAISHYNFYTEADPCFYFEVVIDHAEERRVRDPPAIGVGLWSDTAITSSHGPFSHGCTWGPGSFVYFGETGCKSKWCLTPVRGGSSTAATAIAAAAVPPNLSSSQPLFLSHGAPIDVLDTTGALVWRPAMVLGVDMSGLAAVWASEPAAPSATDSTSCDSATTASALVGDAAAPSSLVVTVGDDSGGGASHAGVSTMTRDDVSRVSHRMDEEVVFAEAPAAIVPAHAQSSSSSSTGAAEVVAASAPAVDADADEQENDNNDDDDDADIEQEDEGGISAFPFSSLYGVSRLDSDEADGEYADDDDAADNNARRSFDDDDGVDHSDGEIDDARTAVDRGSASSSTTAAEASSTPMRPAHVPVPLLSIRVHYIGWEAKWRETIPMDSSSRQLRQTYVPAASLPPRALAQVQRSAVPAAFSSSPPVAANAGPHAGDSTPATAVVAISAVPASLDDATQWVSLWDALPPSLRALITADSSGGRVGAAPSDSSSAGVNRSGGGGAPASPMLSRAEDTSSSGTGSSSPKQERCAPPRTRTIGSPFTTTGWLQREPYGAQFGATHDVIGVWYNPAAGRLSFALNGGPQGVAFEGVFGRFRPAFSLANSNACASFCFFASPTAEGVRPRTTTTATATMGETEHQRVRERAQQHLSMVSRVPTVPSSSQANRLTHASTSTTTGTSSTSTTRMPPADHDAASTSLTVDGALREAAMSEVVSGVTRLARALAAEIALVSAPPRPKACECWRRRVMAVELAEFFPGITVAGAMQVRDFIQCMRVRMHALRACVVAALTIYVSPLRVH